jgi:tripartite-type tricarboxylate transporter receptor subunit TctC
MADYRALIRHTKRDPTLSRTPHALLAILAPAFLGGVMKYTRRQFLQLAAGAAAFQAVAPIAMAQNYPTRPVRFVHGFAAGGSGDIAARLIAQWLSDRLGQQFVVENRTGAGGNIAVETVVRAPADGYTLLQLNVANSINTALYEKLNFNLLADIVPVASFMRVPNVMEVTPSLPVKTVPEFIAYAKANPGKISFASSGVGSSIHMSGELFKAMANIDILHVPYRGIAGGGLSDLMTGVVHVAFDNLPSSIELIRSGKLRALAVTTTTRSPVLPDLPTVADFLPGYEASAWYGIGAPKGTPAEIVERLNRELNLAFADLSMTARIAELGGTPLPGSPADFARFIAAEVEKWRNVVKLSGAKPE